MKAFIWIFAGACFFLSLWIVLPGINLFFLRLAVGVPEISPLLGLANAIAFTFTLVKPSRRGRIWYRRTPWILTALLLISLALYSLPLLQQPSAIAAANRSMAAAFESDIAEPSLLKSVGLKPANIEPMALRGERNTPAFSWLTLLKGFPRQPVRVQRGIPYETSTGVPLTLNLYQPPPSKRSTPERYPAVVTVYGGSWMRGSPAESEAIGHFLAARGYVVAALDYRHAPEHQFPAQLEDVAAGLAFVRSHSEAFEIASDRIALLGWSAGAHLAMLAGFQAEAPVRSIINYYGPVDLFNGYYDIPQPDPIDVREVLKAFIGGTPNELPAAYRAASPLTYIETAMPNSLPPLLLIYGGRDNVVESRFGRKLYESLIEKKNQAVWIEIPWANHAFDKVFNGVSNQMVLHFIERFLAQTLR